jgi:tripartite-type tricarboxylate transporter receptor subunit TctC
LFSLRSSPELVHPRAAVFGDIGVAPGVHRDFVRLVELSRQFSDVSSNVPISRMSCLLMHIGDDKRILNRGAKRAPRRMATGRVPRRRRYVIRFVAGIVALSLLAWGTGSVRIAAAAEYPERPIRFIVPSAPGGTPDIISRVVAAELGKQMGQQVVVDNRPGANGVIGMQMIARSAPDGYTIGYAPVSALAINPSIIKLPYDSNVDLQMVAQLVFGLHILTVTPSLPIGSVQELIDYAKNNPGTLSYGSSGSGSSQHVGMELFKLMTGTQMVHVPYKAIQQAITEVIGGRIQLTFDNLASMLPHVRAGRVRALGVTSFKRSPALPDLPTISEAGVPGFEVTTWSGVIVPAGVPNAIVARLNADINRALISQTIREILAGSGYELVGGTPEQFDALVKKEVAKWADVVKRSGAKVD